MLRIAFVEWPEGLLVDDAQWNGLSESVNAACPDILVTNEMPLDRRGRGVFRKRGEAQHLCPREGAGGAEQP